MRARVWRRAVIPLALCALAAGCGEDPVCGPGSAPAAGISAAVAGEAVTYGGFTSSPNNDCPAPGGGPTSLTIEGTQAGLGPEERFSITLCLPRPDRLGGDPVPLSDTDLVQLVDVNARLADDCRLRLDYADAPQGTAGFAGYCDDGLHGSGYALTLDGEVAGTRICPDGMGGTTEEPVTITLTGSSAVEAITF